MTSASDSRPAWTIHLALIGAQTGFALFPIVGKVALRSLSPMTLAAFRVAAASLLLLLFRRAAGGGERVAPRDRRPILLLAILGVSINQVSFIFGLALTTAINTTILTAMIPIYTLAAAALLGRERLTPRALIAILLGCAGAYGLLGAERFDWRDEYFRGDLLLVANGIAYSFYLVLSRPILARYRVATVVSAVFLYGAAPILIAAIPALRQFHVSAVPASGWASLTAVIILCTVLPYFWNSWALARAPASRVAFYVFLQPVLASILAVAFLGEALTPRRAAAAAVILLGLAVSLSAPRWPAAERAGRVP